MLCENCDTLKVKTSNLCDLCNMVSNVSKANVFEVVICVSELSQKEIIKKTIELYKQNDIMPLPMEIDKNVKKYNISPYLLLSMDIDKKYFFTREAKKYIKSTLKEMFSEEKETEKKPYDIEEYYKLEVYDKKIDTDDVRKDELKNMDVVQQNIIKLFNDE